jgi:hypothetical protein
MSSYPLARTLSIGCLITFMAVTVSAQTLGSFRWQLLPYCNVVTLTVVQQGAHYQLDGTDDQCGTGPQAAVNGLAFLNPNGSIGFGLSIVTAPGGAPVHVDAAISLASLGGTWRDSAGATGTFAFTPGAAGGGSPRPAGGIGLSSINPAQVQARVTGVCSAPELMTGVNQDGTVTCRPDTAGSGDITGVAAGTGLSGGGVAGDVALAVTFAGTGAAPSAARSDHTHAIGEPNSTRIGNLALANRTTGTHNTAVGSGAMELATTGSQNTALGAGALYGNATSGFNVAVGAFALAVNHDGWNAAVGSNALGKHEAGTGNSALGSGAAFTHVTGTGNTAVGDNALWSSASGNYNVAVGQNALYYSLGHNNIAVGRYAGDTLVTGDNNIYIGADGVATESNSTYIGNIFGGTSSSGAAVFINSAGKLGTTTSSARFKENVAPLGDVSRLVQALTPVSFHYKPGFDDGSRVTQYGLIAEDVAEVMPDLVIRDKDGAVQSVRYHFLPPLLLAEVQRLEQERAALTRQVAEQAEAIAELRALIDEMRTRR